MSRDFTITLDGTTYNIVIDGNSILVNGRPFVVGQEGDRVLVDGTPYEITLEEDRVVAAGISYELSVKGLDEEKAGPRVAARQVASEGAVTAIMPGKIIRVLVTQGQQVAEGDVICILEAMKMENELKAPKDGTIKALHIQQGQDVEMGAVLAEID